MATATWRGDARAIAQVATVQITNWDVTTTYILTVGERVVSVLGTVDEDTTAAALNTAWNDSTYPEAEEVSSTVVTDTLTLTADTPGTPFTITSSVSAVGAGTIGVVTDTTTSSGPNDVSVSDNWTGGAGTGGIPDNGDDIVIENSAVSLLYNLDQNAVTPTSLTIKASFTGNIGLPRTNSTATAYTEYRDAFWKVGSGANIAVAIGEGDGVASGRIKLDFSAGQATVTVHKTGTRAEAAIPAVLLKGSHTGNVFAFNRGDVGLGLFFDDACTYTTMRVGFISGQTTDATVKAGIGATQTGGGVITQTGGTLSVSSNVITLSMTGGTTTIAGSATVTTATVHDSTLHYESSGTLTTLNLGDSGVGDFRRDGQGRTVTNINMYAGSSFLDPARTVIQTNDIDLVQCGYEDVTLNQGKHITVDTTAL